MLSRAILPAYVPAFPPRLIDPADTGPVVGRRRDTIHSIASTHRGGSIDSASLKEFNETFGQSRDEKEREREKQFSI